VEISIRKYRERDAKEFQEAVLGSVDHLSEWLPWCTSHYSIADAVEWSKSAVQTWEGGTDYRFLIENSETGEILGSVGINQIVDQHRIGNLGYWVRRTAIGQGVCTSAARKAVSFAFEELGFQRIEIHVQVENHASNAVASKLGGEYEGIFRNKLIFNGESVSAKCYSIIPSDYNT
jgi:RimJ/RimL family protein N-acetyltransferase